MLGIQEGVNIFHLRASDGTFFWAYKFGPLIGYQSLMISFTTPSLNEDMIAITTQEDYEVAFGRIISDSTSKSVI